MKIILLFLYILCVSNNILHSDEASTQLSDKIAGQTRYTMTERSNWSRYDNGSYTGLTHREIRANLRAEGISANTRFSGFFYVLEETKKDMILAARPVDAIKEASFTLHADGSMEFHTDYGYPHFRNFPLIPNEAIKPGDIWEGEAIRVIDPKNNGTMTKIPILVQYTFTGMQEYKGRQVQKIKAKFATRFSKYNMPKVKDPELIQANGTHDAEILINPETGVTMLILDRLDETFQYLDGSTIRFKGNTAIFTESAARVEKTAILSKVKNQNNEASKKNKGLSQNDSFSSSADAALPEKTRFADPINHVQDLPAAAEKSGRGGNGMITQTPETVALMEDGSSFLLEETPKGLRLSVRDIRFMADSDSVLPDEYWRIDALADILRSAEGSQFLVEGHTAKIGKPRGELELSIFRAKKIVDELVKRGIAADRFIYAGFGGEKPIADNATDKGRSMNRRVEITILE